MALPDNASLLSFSMPSIGVASRGPLGMAKPVRPLICPGQGSCCFCCRQSKQGLSASADCTAASFSLSARYTQTLENEWQRRKCSFTQLERYVSQHGRMRERRPRRRRTKDRSGYIRAAAARTTGRGQSYVDSDPNSQL